MARNFYTKIETPNGPVMAHVNRRGCKGRWTKEDQRHFATLVQAIATMTPAEIRKISQRRAATSGDPTPAGDATDETIRG